MHVEASDDVTAAGAVVVAFQHGVREGDPLFELPCVPDEVGAVRLGGHALDGRPAPPTNPGVALMWSMPAVQAARSRALCCGPSGSSRKPSPTKVRGTVNPAGTKAC
ncbi:hypothetical protein ABZY34_22995 [Streptomyces virginiae]|uniref:hypothetical protein n=1 Tax=Streptomyces virginiae TaxID=1961 RepID=UPI0033B938B9